VTGSAEFTFETGRSRSGFFCLHWTRLLSIVLGLLLLWLTALLIR
jgi:hypothetical protein